MTILEGVIKGGQLVLEGPLPFPEGTRVKVRLEAAGEDPLRFLAENAVATGIPDLAEQHDHYIYGAPKQAK
jgi:hypothetical protein